MTTTDPAVTTWQQTLDSNDTDDLFHVAADYIQERRAEAGLSWRTLCGQNRPPAHKVREWDPVEPDDCVVCLELEVGELA